MYTPKHFAETDVPTLHTFMQANSFALLVSSQDDVPTATHLPFMLDAERGEWGTLIAHFAKANPHWQMLTPETEVLVVFQGPHSYISSSWYTPPTVVPTWNYTAVHATGKPRLIHEPDQLKAIVTALVRQHDPDLDVEAAFPYPSLQAIVGIEIEIDRLEGKFKMNQNKTRATREAVIERLGQSEDTMQQAVANIMQSKMKDS